MEKMSGFACLALAIDEALEADPKVICIGEDIGAKGGCWGYFTGMIDKYGKNRIIQTPISETGYTDFAVGIGYGGYRPVVEYMFADFATLGFDGIVNIAAKARFNSNGEVAMPITFMLPEGGGGKSGCQHSQCVEAWFANIPGLKIVCPTSPDDLRKFYKAAVMDNDPVLFIFGRTAMFAMEEEVDKNDKSIPSLLNAAKVVKEGADLTAIAWHIPLMHVMGVVGEVEKETGKTVEIIDPRVLKPLDEEAIYKSVRKTGRVLIAHEAPESGGYGTIISGLIGENCLKDLKAPVSRIGSHNIPVPFGTTEDKVFPEPAEIKAKMIELLK